MNNGWWVLLGVVIGALSTGMFNLLLHKLQFTHEKKMFILKNQSIENVKLLLKEKLSHNGYIDRSFKTLKNL